MKKRMIMSTANIEVPEEDLQQLRSICKDLIYSRIQGMSVISQACVLLEEYKQLLAAHMVHEATKPDDHLTKLNSILAYQQARVQRCNALLMDIEHSMDSLCESKACTYHTLLTDLRLPSRYRVLTTVGSSEGTATMIWNIVKIAMCDLKYHNSPMFLHQLIIGAKRSR